MKSFLLLLVGAVFLPLTSAVAQRQVVGLPDGWRFLKHEAALDAPSGADWQTVTLPHCYNAHDGQNGKAADPDEPEGYYRGPTWYQRTLDVPADWRQKRVFVRFEAAFLVADVYLNGTHLGQHRGGFAAFCYELTPQLRFGGSNDLRVRVDNSKNLDIAPLSADFTMEGGIYRPVSLIVTDQVCITPLDFAGPGVYATPSRISAAGADVEVETKLLDPSVPVGDTSLARQIHTEIRDADGKTVLQGDTPATGTSVKQPFHLDRPHLWKGLEDPYVYTVNVKIMRRGQATDEVTQPLGFRTTEITQDQGFLLNGQPYKIYGVNRHQEKRDQGWALSNADHALDFQMIREMGATAVRLAHYQQSNVVHDLCDHNGLLLWQEIPVVNEITESPAFTDNCKQQLTEMIRQGYNHPSILTWGLFNELNYRKETDPKLARCKALISSLESLARELDPTRTPASVTCHPETPTLSRITEWIGFNSYPGWYNGVPEDFDKAVQRNADSAGGKRIAMTEYGAGANPAQHQEGTLLQPKPTGPFHPEEWQAHTHEVDWKRASDNPHLWGTFIWVMFDFASDGRNEGSNPGVNDKGMVTEDRRTKKDAFYFYKANWNPEPMVFLASRRLTTRRNARTEVKVYTACRAVELKVNGQSVGTLEPSDTHVCVWRDVMLKPGINQVEAAAAPPGGQRVTDRCEWTLVEGPALNDTPSS